jgi:hypothetical protein
MKQISESSVDELSSIFKEEIQLYKELLKIENAKKDSIMKSEAKKLEDSTKKTMELIQKTSILESKRMKCISDIYDSAKLEKSGDVPVLTEFLNQIDRGSNYKLKGLANELKDTVRSLREKISINEKLLKTKQEIYSMSIDALKDAADIEISSSYEGPNPKKGRTSVLLNTSV